MGAEGWWGEITFPKSRRQQDEAHGTEYGPSALTLSHSAIPPRRPITKHYGGPWERHSQTRGWGRDNAARSKNLCSVLKARNGLERGGRVRSEKREDWLRRWDVQMCRGGGTGQGWGKQSDAVSSDHCVWLGWARGLGVEAGRRVKTGELAKSGQREINFGG